MLLQVFTLSIKADLENIESISLPEDSSYTLTVKDSAGDDQREGVVVSPLEEQELSGSRGTAHFALKWSRDARHEASLSLQHIKGVTRALTAADAGKFVPIVAFECRGLDPIAWQPQASGKGWAPSGMVWEDVDLSSGEWAEYDEKSGEAVSVMELEWRFDTYRPKK
ncbi:UPF0587 protein C1orf123-like protein [Auxenochlorella protothecoides]|uniref:UPF0587 protein C1orf123-like protein n=1 Tax=Auxenochlorella protothecoides TaxID=3075 RepID=A0A087SJ68_AUXPR|nr:UPF0587 protein C1orf123-like protein [Auxenochlorella protothecoides]KFM25772.1 UPF0587 protein C1orf123-like protein [Auxenochlorella protothecoides]